MRSICAGTSYVPISCQLHTNHISFLGISSHGGGMLCNTKDICTIKSLYFWARNLVRDMEGVKNAINNNRTTDWLNSWKSLGKCWHPTAMKPGGSSPDWQWQLLNLILSQLNLICSFTPYLSKNHLMLSSYIYADLPTCLSLPSSFSDQNSVWVQIILFSTRFSNPSGWKTK
jgi:hypothetical protein